MWFFLSLPNSFVLFLLFNLFTFPSLVFLIFFLSFWLFFSLFFLHRLFSIPLTSDLHCSKCPVQETSWGQVPSPLDPLCHLQPDPWPVGLHPFPKVGSTEITPSRRLVQKLYDELIPIFPRNYSQVHSAFSPKQPGPRRKGGVKLDTHN